MPDSDAYGYRNGKRNRESNTEPDSYSYCNSYCNSDTYSYSSPGVEHLDPIAG